MQTLKLCEHRSVVGDSRGRPFLFYLSWGPNERVSLLLSLAGQQVFLALPFTESDCSQSCYHSATWHSSWSLNIRVCVCVFMMRLQLIVSLLDPSRDSTSHGQCGTIIFIIENHLHVSGPTQSKFMLFMGQLSLTSVWTLAYKVPGFIPTLGSCPSIFRLLNPNHQESLPFSVVHWLQLLWFHRHVFQACFISHVDCVSLEVRGIHPQLD